MTPKNNQKQYKTSHNSKEPSNSYKSPKLFIHELLASLLFTLMNPVSMFIDSWACNIVENPIRHIRRLILFMKVISIKQHFKFIVHSKPIFLFVAIPICFGKHFPLENVIFVQ
jgi:hypothetical protein